MHKSQKIRSNGYGSFQQRIVVRVETEHVETFAEAFDAKPFRTTQDHTDFVVQASSRYKGDDETIMYDIDYRLPDLPSFKGWKILWDESFY